MKRTWIRYTVICAVMVLAACASLLGPRNVEIPLSKLQASLDNRFPFNNRYLDLFDIQLRSPRLALQPGSNRIMTTFDASVAPTWIRRSWQGNFALSGVLALDPARNAVILTDPRMESVNINGMDSMYANQVGKVLGLLTEQVFKGIPLYTFDPAEFRFGGMSFLPTKINTYTNGLVVTFEPVK